MQIVVKPLVTKKQAELVRALIRKGYFASETAAFAYADAISNFIQTISKQTIHKTKDTSFGQYYATYKANRHTSWYVLFDMSNDRYIIRNLINNHTPDYPKFIDSLKQS
jgi:hypothetical protein